jgi:aspartokinase
LDHDEMIDLLANISKDVLNIEMIQLAKKLKVEIVFKDIKSNETILYVKKSRDIKKLNSQVSSVTVDNMIARICIKHKTLKPAGYTDIFNKLTDDHINLVNIRFNTIDKFNNTCSFLVEQKSIEPVLMIIDYHKKSLAYNDILVDRHICLVTVAVLPLDSISHILSKLNQYFFENSIDFELVETNQNILSFLIAEDFAIKVKKFIKKSIIDKNE